jgi:outer membrane protein assembly factor BamD
MAFVRSMIFLGLAILTFVPQAQGKQQIATGETETIGNCRAIIRRDRTGAEAPDALRRMGLIYQRQHRLRAAFRCFHRILERYPDYPRYLDVLALEFEVAERLMGGERVYFFGKIPGFKDREGAIEFFRKIIEQAPYGELAPRALMNIAQLSMRMRNPVAAIEALETILDQYGHSPVAPDALLMLARVHRGRVLGPDHDQRATHNAANAYQEFLLLFPNSPLVLEAEDGLRETNNLMAAGYLNLGNFYYDNRQRPSAALPYYELAVATAPQSEIAERARARMDDISAGKAGHGSPIDVLIGRYRG